MDYEKKYNEALERAKDVKNGPSPHDSSVATVEYIFPELRESEDERINKAIFKALSKKEARDVLLAEGVQVSDALSYLERQKEHVPENEGSGTRKEQKASEVSDEYKKGFECGKQRVLKYPEEFNLQHVEQNPAWSEEDKLTVDAAIYWLEERLRIERADDISTECSPLSMRKTAERLKSLRPSWKPSEEQMEFLKGLPGLLRNYSLDSSAIEIQILCEQLEKL